MYSYVNIFIHVRELPQVLLGLVTAPSRVSRITETTRTIRTGRVALIPSLSTSTVSLRAPVAPSMRGLATGISTNTTST